jgi:hypothetical protein
LYGNTFYCKERYSVVWQYVLLYGNMFYCKERYSVLCQYVLLYGNMSCRTYCQKLEHITIQQNILALNGTYCHKIKHYHTKERIALQQNTSPYNKAYCHTSRHIAGNMFYLMAMCSFELQYVLWYGNALCCWLCVLLNGNMFYCMVVSSVVWQYVLFTTKHIAIQQDILPYKRTYWHTTEYLSLQ